MGEEARNPKENHTASAGSVRKGGFFYHLRFHHVVALVSIAFVVVFTSGEFLKTPLVAETSTNQSMFSIPAEISQRYDSCNYAYLFICENKSNDVPPPMNCE